MTVITIESMPDNGIPYRRTMEQLAASLQRELSTPELRDLINALHDLYEPTDEMLEAAKYDNAASARAWPYCMDN